MRISRNDLSGVNNDGPLKSGPGGIKFYPDLYTNAGRNTGFNIQQQPRLGSKY